MHPFLLLNPVHVQSQTHCGKNLSHVAITHGRTQVEATLGLCFRIAAYLRHILPAVLPLCRINYRRPRPSGPSSDSGPFLGAPLRLGRNPLLGFCIPPRKEYVNKRIGAEGFEPSTFWSRTRRATRLRYTPIRSDKNLVRGVL
jgi:hypothetical protein